ncbi:MAG: hypothetical protein CVV45_14095 [Spirochaetae bacterium HGW-Spirochaetae-10]|nr:MAG: hypothetical protein CVV45_14095 [Spirochaetae bacterium HGW-Spirochaetae-10]
MVRFSFFRRRWLTSQDAEIAEQEGRGKENEEEITTETRRRGKGGERRSLFHEIHEKHEKKGKKPTSYPSL